jgi:hypothetical protein
MTCNQTDVIIGANDEIKRQLLNQTSCTDIELRGDNFDNSQAYIDLYGINKHNVEIGAEHILTKLKSELRGENLKLLELKASIHEVDQDVSYYGRQVEKRTGHFGVVQPTDNTSGQGYVYGGKGVKRRILLPKLPMHAISGLLTGAKGDALKDEVKALEIRLENDRNGGSTVDVRAQTSGLAENGAKYLKTYLTENVTKNFAHWVRKGTIITVEEGHSSRGISKNTQLSHFDDDRHNGNKRYRSDSWDGFRGKSKNNIPYLGGRGNNLL